MPVFNYLYITCRGSNGWLFVILNYLEKADVQAGIRFQINGTQVS